MAKKKTISKKNVTSLTFDTLPAYCEKHAFKFIAFQEENEPPTIRLDFPSDGERYSLFVTCMDNDDVAALGRIKFEQFSVLSELVAIVDAASGDLEALIHSNTHSKYSGVWFALRDHLPIKFVHKGITATIQEASSELRLICRERSQDKLCSLRIAGLEFPNLAEARTTLTTISDALFFALELNDEMTLALTMRTRFHTQGFDKRFRKLIARQEKSGMATKFPLHKYDAEPMNLYRYGAFASQMPLLRYLAFYQVLEFYFPICAHEDAIRNLQGLLKNPAFDLYDTSDIASVLNVVDKAKSKLAEREMLTATLRQCVSEKEMFNFLTADEEQMKWFAQPIKGVTSQKINLNESATDKILNDVVTRIYDIRCAIVHTKSGNGTGAIRPFSRHEHEMFFDTELVQFLARRILIQRSTRMS